MTLLIIGLGVGLGSMYAINFVSSGGGNQGSPILPPVGNTTTTSSEGRALSVSCTPNPIAVGSGASCSAVLKSYSKSASGTVTWKDNGTGTFPNRGICTLSQGTCSATFDATAVGAAMINATFSGNKDNPPSWTALDIAVTQFHSLDSLSCTSVTSIGETSVCAARISGFGTPTGDVNFTASGSGNFSSSICSLSGGSCSVSYTPTSVSSSQSIVSSYSGDADNTPSTSNSFTLGVSLVSTVVFIGCSPATITIGSNSTCQVSVHGYNPTGNVSLSSTDSGATFSPSSTCDISSGSCTVTYVPASLGAATIAASYSGDSNNSADSNSTAVTVETATSGVHVSCSPPTDPIGSGTKCTVSVIGDNPTGSVSWSSSAAGLFAPAGTCTLSSGSCSVTYAPTSPTTPVTIQAAYGGDSNNQAGTSTFELTVSISPSTIKISCSPDPIDISSQSTCTATVNGYSPSGTVSFSSTDTGANFSPMSCGLVTTGNSGSCQVTYTPSTVGKATITGSYPGDSNNGPATNTYVINVMGAPSKTSVNCISPIAIGGQTTCTISVTGYGTPTGSVNFSSSDSGATFSPVACSLSGGTCQVTYTPSVAGSATIRAIYSGDTTYTPSTGSGNVVVNQVTPTVSVLCNPSIIPTGGSASCTVTVTDTVTGYNPTGTITWQTSGTGTFYDGHANPTTTCTLSAGQCNVQYDATNDIPGANVTISVSYSGDVNDLQASGATQISITL